MAAILAFKPVTYIVAYMTRAAVSVTDDELAAGVRLFAAETADTKVVGVGEAAPVPCIGSPVFPGLVRDCGGVLAQVLCYFAEGLPLIQGLFALVNKNWTLKLYFFPYNLRLLYSRICFSVLFRRQISE